MTPLERHIQDYLRMRRALGFKLTFAGQVLPQFAAYLEAMGASTLTVESAKDWASLPQGVQPISLAHRLGTIRGFARYLHTIDPATEVPPLGIWPTVARRPTPYLWSEPNLHALLVATRQLQPSLARGDTRDAVRTARGVRPADRRGARAVPR